MTDQELFTIILQKLELFQEFRISLCLAVEPREVSLALSARHILRSRGSGCMVLT